MNKTTLRSLWAVTAGVLFIVIVTTLVDIVMHVTGVYPTNKLTHGLAVVASSYRLVISIAGAWLTARLAPARPLKHALILGVVGTLLGTIGAVATWNLDLGPHWYPVSLAVLALPQCWFGGWLFARGQPAVARD